MSKISGHAQNQTQNCGEWLSAKIYSDDKQDCLCGEAVWLKEPIKGLEKYSIPVCKCGEYPKSFVIVAKVITEDGIEKRIKVRHSQEGIRLKDYLDVVYTLRKVSQEIKEKTFEVKRYESIESRESFKFSNFVKIYEKHFEDQKLIGSITKGGLKDKKTLIKNHLLPYFKDSDIALINDTSIKKFFRSYTTTLRMRDRATAELKTILKWAIAEKKLRFLPLFPEIPAAKMVSSDSFIKLETQEKILSKIENPIYKAAIKTLQIYGLRQCDILPLRKMDIDRKEMVFYIRSHMSENEITSGRKSQKDIVHTLPIESEFLEVLDSIPTPLHPEDLMFPGQHGGVIGGNVLRRHWAEACKLAKVKHVQLYVGTKHSTLSRLGKTHSDSELIKLSGHTNTKTIRRYNQASVNDIRSMLK